MKQETVNLDELTGRIVRSIEWSDSTLVIYFDDGAACLFDHDQDGDETVNLVSMWGKASHLIGKQLTTASVTIMSGETKEIFIFVFSDGPTTISAGWLGESERLYSTNIDVRLIEKGTVKHLHRKWYA